MELPNLLETPFGHRNIGVVHLAPGIVHRYRANNVSQVERQVMNRASGTRDFSTNLIHLYRNIWWVGCYMAKNIGGVTINAQKPPNAPAAK